jgi:hypothetical protein
MQERSQLLSGAGEVPMQMKVMSMQSIACPFLASPQAAASPTYPLPTMEMFTLAMVLR